MRILAYMAAILLGIGAIGYVALYGVSELKLRNVPDPPPFDHPIATDAASQDRGRHIARTRGCFGCHGQQLEGRVFTDEWSWTDRGVAPNLAALAREHDVATLEAAIRHGIGHDGRALWSMPSYNWVHLADADLAALIAYLRSARVVPSDLPPPRLGLRARWAIVNGRLEHMAALATQVPPLRGNPVDPQLVRGEYLAMTTCNECHGFDLRGAVEAGLATPDLAILAAYTEADFRRLMKEGTAIGGRADLGLMTMVARDRFAHFTERELADLLAFLRTLPAEPVPKDAPWRRQP